MLCTLTLDAQTKIDLKSYKNSFAFDPVIAMDMQGNVFRGIFLELNGDSLKILINSSVQSIGINSIKQLKISAERASTRNMINLAFAGAFGAQLLLNKKDWQSDKFIQSDGGIWPHLLVGVLGAIGGGLIGLGIDMANSEKELEFNLQDPQDVKRMRKVIQGEPDRTMINFYYEISKVYSRVDPNSSLFIGSNNENQNVTLNVFRSLRLTANITEKIETGIAMYSAAEPNIRYSSYSPDVYSTEEMTNKVYGYYATAFYDLVGGSDGSTLSLKPGLEIGIANIDYTIRLNKSVYDNVNFKTIVSVESNTLTKTLLSGFIALDARFYPATGVSLAVTGDFVFIPGKTLSSNLTEETGKTFSNFSLGVSLGLHF